MPRFLLGWLLGLGGNAVGLILASLILGDKFSLRVSGFLVSLIAFAVLSALFTWLVLKFLLRTAGSIVALTGLISISSPCSSPPRSPLARRSTDGAGSGAR